MGGGGSSSPSQTPAEAEAYQAAQPFLQEYNSGKLNAPNQAAVNLIDTNQTANTLQQFASSGMLGDSQLANLVGTVKKGGATGGMQAGAGSVIDLSKLSLTQQILQSDLNTGMAYLSISSGQAADLAGVQQEQSSLLANALGSAANSAAGIMSTSSNAPPPGTDMSLSQNTPYSGPGAMDSGTEFISNPSDSEVSNWYSPQD